ncbi:purine/pyrimidine permease [Ectobacillus ponti]|uniref:Purine/pyrimidine permease n=1 Tax=Ectobacillus ponti TaxID=2961894 RepID=A0AA41X714_9BACI|nr:purine/pyrimidine permease [Ectobacillus ponti]MCP8968015.1 purine/pyrimidine permease [Ectobacillus ponti]
MKLFFSALQWAFFILAGSLVVPISVASSYGLEGADAVAFVQRTLFVLGIAGFLQALFGHRLPVYEGPAGLWWGVMTLYAGLGSVLFGSTGATLQVLQYSFILSGIICILLSLFGLVDKLVRYFTPTVVGTYLFLLVAQLSGSFLKGMLGTSNANPAGNGSMFALSIIVVAIAILAVKLPYVGSYSVLLSMGGGWLLFYLFGLTKPIPHSDTLFQLPKLFVFGMPRIEGSMVITVIIVTLLLLTNMLASIRVVQQVLARQEVPFEANRFKQAGIMSGVAQILGGMFSAVGPVAISGSAGFIAATRINKRLPFLLGSGLVILISLLPGVTAFFATIPAAIGYAAIYPVFAGMVGLAFREYDSVTDKERLRRTTGLGLFTGIGVMFVPSGAWASFPPFLTSLLSNGLVLGSVIVILLEVLSSKARQRA